MGAPPIFAPVEGAAAHAAPCSADGDHPRLWVRRTRQRAAGARRARSGGAGATVLCISGWAVVLVLHGLRAARGPGLEPSRRALGAPRTLARSVSRNAALNAETALGRQGRGDQE